MWFRDLLRRLLPSKKKAPKKIPKKTTSIELLRDLSPSQLRYIARKRGVASVYRSREELIQAILSKDSKK